MFKKTFFQKLLISQKKMFQTSLLGSKWKLQKWQNDPFQVCSAKNEKLRRLSEQ